MKCLIHSFVFCSLWFGYSSQNSLDSTKRFDHESNDGYMSMAQGLSRGLVSLSQRSHVKGTDEDGYESPTFGNGLKSQTRKREAPNSKRLSSLNFNIFNPNNIHGEFKREVHYSGSSEHGDTNRIKRQADAPEGGSGDDPRRGGRVGRRGRRGRRCCQKGGGKGDSPAEAKEGATEGAEEKKRRKRELSQDHGEALVRVRRQDAPEGGGEDPPKGGGRGGRRRFRNGRLRRCRCGKKGDKNSEEPSGDAPAEERKKREAMTGPEERAPWGKSGVSPHRLKYAPESGITLRRVSMGVIVLMHHRHRPSTYDNRGRDLEQSNTIDTVENNDRKKREDTVSEGAEDESFTKLESPHKKDRKLKHLLKSHNLKRLHSVKSYQKSVTDDSKSSKLDGKVERMKREATDEDAFESKEKERKKREAEDDDDDESKEKASSAGGRSVPGDKDTPGCYGQWKNGGGGGGGGPGGGGEAAGGGLEQYRKAAKYQAKGKKKNKG